MGRTAGSVFTEFHNHLSISILGSRRILSTLNRIKVKSSEEKVYHEP